MSSGHAKRVSPKDIQMVQNLIERCLQLYMNQKEVVETLLAQAKIEPAFTELVWQKLEEENRDFFNAYYLRLMVKNQIMQFNKLLEQQVQLMREMNSSTSLPTANGNHMTPLHRNSTLFNSEHMAPSIKSEGLHHVVGSRMHTAFNNGGSEPSLHHSLHSNVDMSIHSNRINVPPDMLTSQSSNLNLMHGLNGGLIKSETGYSCTTQFMLPPDGSALETRPMVDVSGQSFSSVESNAQALHLSSLLDPDNAFGQLGQFPRNFSLSDLTADYAQSSDILESYSGSAFLVADNDGYLDSHELENQGEKRLDTISEGVSCDDFGSE